MLKIILAAAIAAGSLASPASLTGGRARVVEAAPQRWLSGQEITSELSGKTLDGRYASGRAFTEHYGADGRLDYREASRSSGGHWSVTAGTLCTIYDDDPAGGCFRVNRAGVNCYEFYFVARTEAQAPGPDGTRPSWTAHGSIAGRAGSCADRNTSV